MSNSTKNATVINEFIQHPLKAEIESRRIRQYDLCYSLRPRISQSTLSNHLNGLSEMPENIERQITSILTFIKNKKRREK